MIAHNKPSLSCLESTAITDVMANGWIAEGEQVQQFEDEFCQLYDLPQGHAVAVSSGSAALYLSLMAVNAKSKKVAIPAYSCASLENAALLAGARVKYIDCQRGSFNIAASACVEADIIIHAHLFGIPSIFPNYQDKIVIEDCAQAIGATVNGSLVGLQGDLGVFSFYATKLMTSAGQGGMIISKNKKLIDFIRDFIHFDGKCDAKLRFNFLMTDIQASVGRIQLQRLFNEFIPAREVIMQHYLQTGLPFYRDSDSRLHSVKFRALLQCSQPYKLMNLLKEENIKSIVPIEADELLGKAEKLDNALFNSANWLSLPCYPTLSLDELAHIKKCLIRARHLL